MPTSEDIVVGLVTAIVVIVCVLIHFEALRMLADKLPKPKWHPRRRMIALIFAMLFLHVFEVWIFGVAYWYLIAFGQYGAIMGADVPTLVDCIYFSAAVFSTVGFGDLYPVGPIRVMTGTEAITGLTLITWSASYAFVEMLKTWEPDE